MISRKQLPESGRDASCYLVARGNLPFPSKDGYSGTRSRQEFDQMKTLTRMRWSFRLTALLIACLAVRPAIAVNTNIVHSFALNPSIRVLDNQFQGIVVASDGNCYFGSSTHDYQHGASFWRYDPRTYELTLLAEDISLVCGEQPPQNVPQGKIHSVIVEHNGWLYFATHLANYWGEAKSNYTGGHIVGYKLATGQFRDLGIVRSNYTVYSALGLDRPRGKLYAFLVPALAFDPGGTTNLFSRIYRIDIASGAKEDLGPVKQGKEQACFHCVVDGRGDVWFSVRDDQGALVCARADSGTIERFEDVLPESNLGPPRFWIWAQTLPDGDRCVFNLYGSGTNHSDWLYILDTRFIRSDPTNAFQRLRNVGFTDLGTCLSQNRIFYIQRANRRFGSQGYMDLHLLSVSLETNSEPPILDYGLIADQAGRLAYRIPGLAADAQGHVFMIGDWWTLLNDPPNMRSLRYYHPSGYEELTRGEFFAARSVAPALRVQTDPLNETLSLSWELATTGFLLTAKTNLSSPEAWIAVTNAITTRSNKNEITLPVSQSKEKFFRLEWR